MDNQLSLEEQVELCRTTEDYLNELNAELRYVSKHYQDSIDDLKSFGYFKEKMPELEVLCGEFDTSIDEVMKYVESSHIEYVASRRKTIEYVLS